MGENWKRQQRGVKPMQQRALRCLSLLLYMGVAVGAVWLSVRFLLPWGAPFLLALALAALLEHPVRALVRRGWRRGAASALLSVAALSAVLMGLFRLGSRCLSALTELARRSPELVSGMAQGIGRLEGRLLAWIDSAPPEMAEVLRSALDGLAEALYGVPALLSQSALDAASRAAQYSPDALLFAVTFGIGTYFFSASFPRVMRFLERQLPEEQKRRLEDLGRDLRGSFSGFLRAQLLLMVLTFCELLLAFLLLRVESAFGLAALTALVDALPVFGTGTVLLPWAGGCLLLGDSGRALGLAVTWALVNIVRSAAQAKLLGDQIGLDPLASLIAVYVGWKLGRVWGMLLCPLVAVTLQQLNDRGVVHLWKSL